MRLLQLKITARLVVGFGALVLLGVGASSYGVRQLWSVGSNVQSMQSLAENFQSMLESDRLLEIQRRAEYKFSIDGGEEALAEGRGAAAEIMKRINEIIGANSTDDRNRSLKDIVADLNKHEELVQTFSELSKTISVERSKLLSDGDNLMTSLGKISDLAHATKDPVMESAVLGMERSLLLLRVSNWRNLLTLEKQGLSNFKRTADAAVYETTVLEKVADQPVKQELAILRPI